MRIEIDKQALKKEMFRYQTKLSIWEEKFVSVYQACKRLEIEPTYYYKITKQWWIGNTVRLKLEVGWFDMDKIIK
jgi:hypothetical protein